MRVALLLLVLAETAWIGVLLGRVVNHYEYLESTCTSALDYCDRTVERIRKDKSCD